MSIKFFGKKSLKVRIPPYSKNKFSGKILENSSIYNLMKKHIITYSK
jgi:hypothetical protein